MLGCKRAWGAAAVAVVTLALGAAAVAGNTPDLQISIEVDGQVFNYNPSLGNNWQNPSGSFGFYGQTPVGGQPFQFAWDMVANPNGTSGLAGGGPVGAFLIANTLYTNTSMNSQTVTITITQALDMPMSSTLVGGSVSGSLTAGSMGGGASSDGFLYQALADGGFVAGLLNNLGVSAGAFGSAAFGPESFGQPIPSQPFGAINDTIGVQYSFSLSGGASLALTGSFTAIPAPGAIALLGMAALAGTSRRRRA